MTPRQVRKYCVLKPESMSLLKAAMEDLALSARAHDKVLRVARMIADLGGAKRGCAGERENDRPSRESRVWWSVESRAPASLVLIPQRLAIPIFLACLLFLY